MEIIINLRQNSESRKFFPMKNVTGETSVASLKNQITAVSGVDSANLELVYCGKTLVDEDTIAGLGLSDRSVIHVLEHPKKEVTVLRTLSAEEQRELVLAFRTAMTNPNFRQTLQTFTQPEKLADMATHVSGLKEDSVARSFIRDWELLLHLADAKTLQKIAKKYPALADAGFHIAGMLREAFPALDLRALRGSQQGRLARSLGADLDDDDMEDEEVPGTRTAPEGSTITPEQLAQALAFAQRTAVAQSPSALNFGTPRPQPSTSSSSSASSLTQQMLNDALMRAVASIGNTRPGNETESLQQQFGRFLPQMRELGITDDTLSLRALQAANGDVQTAVNLIFAGLMED